MVHALLEDSGRYGLGTATANFLKTRNVSVQTVGLTPEIQEILVCKPVIVIGNHPTVTEPCALLAVLSERKDLKMVMQRSIVEELPSGLQKDFFPVSNLALPKEPLSLQLVKLSDFLIPRKNCSSQEQHQRNIQSIKDAANYVSSGGLLMFFPNPGERKMSVRWHKGIAHLIKEVKNPYQTYLVSCFVQGLSPLDILRIFPLTWWLLPRKVVTVRFIDATPLNEYAGLSISEMLNKLRLDYLEHLRFSLGSPACQSD